MKQFKITLKSGDWTYWKAENKEDVLMKIKTGHYGILPVRGNDRLIISEDSLDRVEEVS